MENFIIYRAVGIIAIFSLFVILGLIGHVLDKTK